MTLIPPTIIIAHTTPSSPPPIAPHHIHITYQVLPFLNISTPSLVCYPLASNVIIFTSCHPFHNTSSLSTSCSNVAVIASSHFGITGLATAVGEQPVKGLLNNKAQARMTVGETGILFVVRTECRCLFIIFSFFLSFFLSLFLSYFFPFTLPILFACTLPLIPSATTFHIRYHLISQVKP